MPGFFIRGLLFAGRQNFKRLIFQMTSNRMIAKNNLQKMLLFKYYCSNYQYKYVMVACYISSAF